MSTFCLNLCLRTDNDTSTTSLVCLTDAIDTTDDTTCREVWTLHILHQFRAGQFGVVDVGNTSVNHFRKVVGRNVGCHTYCDTRGAIHQQVGDASRENGWLFLRVVEVVHHIDRFLVDVLKHCLAQFAEACLSVTHGGSTVTVHRAEVSLSFDEGVSHCPRLCQTHQGTVNGRVAVRVEVTEHITHDTGTLYRWFV